MNRSTVTLCHELLSRLEYVEEGFRILEARGISCIKVGRDFYDLPNCFSTNTRQSIAGDLQSYIREIKAELRAHGMEL